MPVNGFPSTFTVIKLLTSGSEKFKILYVEPLKSITYFVYDEYIFLNGLSTVGKILLLGLTYTISNGLKNIVDSTENVVVFVKIL